MISPLLAAKAYAAVQSSATEEPGAAKPPAGAPDFGQMLTHVMNDVVQTGHHAEAQMVAGVTDGATCAANDFALVQVTGSAKRRVSSTVPYWNGPSGVATLPAEGATVFGLARSSASARALPRIGTVGPVGTGAATVSTPLPSTQRARGGGFLDDQGRAVGVLTRSAASGHNTVVSLADVVGYAAAHGVPGLQLVPGHGTFSGAAVL